MRAMTLLRISWIALGFALGAVFLMQVCAGLELRGLYADGAYYAEQLLLRQNFVVIEPSRMTSQLLVQAPVVLMMRLGLDSPHTVALAVSLAGNLVPLSLTLASLAVLPRADRAFALFPLIVFLAATMSAAFASVADGATAAAYAWLLLLLVLFGRLTPARLVAIVLLAAGALRLHEETAFLGPVLACACLLRRAEAEGRAARIILALTAAFLLAGCLIAIHDVLHPRVTSNRTSFIEDVVRLRWLVWYGGRVNMMAIPGLLAVPALVLLTLRPVTMRWMLPGLGGLFLAVAGAALALPACAPAAFAARDNGCLLTAPAMLLLIGLRSGAWRPAWPPLPATVLLTAMLGLAIACGDARANLAWLGYRQAMGAALAASSGVVPWQVALRRLPARQAKALADDAWPWTTPLMSLWLSRGPIVTTIIANPRGIAWQPFDPDSLRGLLGADKARTTRTGFVALLRPARPAPRPDLAQIGLPPARDTRAAQARQGASMPARSCGAAPGNSMVAASNSSGL